MITLAGLIRGWVASSPLDDFLADTTPNPSAVRLETIGLAVGLPALMVAIGLIGYLALVHRGSRAEVTALVRVAIVAALVAAFGAVVEVLGAARLFEISWADAFADGTAAAAMMRLMAALMIALGLFDHVATCPPTTEDTERVGDEVVRWVPSAASAFALVGAALAVLSFSFDGHTVSASPRVATAILDTVHVAAGAVWLGGVVGLTIVAWGFRRGRRSIARLLIQFSGVATVSLVAVTVAGAVMSWIIVDGVDDYTDTEWGRRLIVKVLAVAFVASGGAFNHYLVLPRLEASGSPASHAESDETLTAPERMARRVLIIEFVAFAVVLALTVLLMRSSTV